MISAELTSQIRRLFFAEHWKIGTIAAALSVHPTTVRNAIESNRFNFKQTLMRQKLTDHYLNFIESTLKQYPGLRATRLYQMVKARGYCGSIQQLRRLLQHLRPRRTEAFFRLSMLPGEQAQADWAHFGTVQVGAAKRKLSGFVITLSYCRALWVEFFFDQGIENFLSAHCNAFSAWGGVPRTILYDNLKSVVAERPAIPCQPLTMDKISS